MYDSILKEFDLDAEFLYPWLHVGHTERIQGWKLHVSSIQTEAPKLLRVLLPLLRSRSVSFKIPRDPAILSRLNEGLLGPTQVGKFMTIYPESNAQAGQLAALVAQETRGFHGPIVLSDLRLGEVLYARYGGFKPIIVHDRLGRSERFIQVNGSLKADEYQIPFELPKNVRNPFSSLLGKTRIDPVQSASSSKILGPGYLVLDVVKAHPKGSVFRALDLRSQLTVSIKVIKQGRQYCFSDAQGRDMRDRLQHQARLHHAICNVVPIPGADPYFEVNGTGYLPLEQIEGENLEHFMLYSSNEAARKSGRRQVISLLSIITRVCDAVEQLHAAGYVHRDLTARNIRVTTNQTVYLLDLELAHALNDPTPPFWGGTPGFMSPQQEGRQAPKRSDDVYALGGLLILLLTGFDPRRILFASDKQRVRQIRELAGAAAPSFLCTLIARCVSSHRRNRPEVSTLKQAVQDWLTLLTSDTQRGEAKLKRKTADQERRTVKLKESSELVTRGARGLIGYALTEKHSNLWLSSASEPNAQVMEASSYSCRRAAHRGIAGVVYLLSRLARLGRTPPGSFERVQQAIEWLLANEPSPDERLPGLHFGEAGVAVALAEAVAGGFLTNDQRVSSFFAQALKGALDWPDITHGAAGQGLAALYCEDRLGDAALAKYAHRCADYLVRNQEADGSWVMPPGVDGMSGQTLTGFAHGVAGIVYFLAEYAHRFHRKRADLAWRRGSEWLMNRAIPSRNSRALEWEYSDLRSERWKWWCHGSPGIALTFLRLYERTEDPDFADVARKALRANSKGIRHSNLSQCHGLSGLGEIYLEGSRVLGEGEWRRRANDIAHVLTHLRREREGSANWLVEDPYVSTADLMVGCSGVVHFFLRHSLSGRKLGFPLLLDPIPVND